MSDPLIATALVLSGRQQQHLQSACFKMAAQKVFDTTELMETILAFLPLPSLLRVQVVCQQWRDVTRVSSLLQQKLFLRPSKDDTIWLVDITNLPAQDRPLRRDFRTYFKVKAAVSRKSELYKTHFGLTLTPAKINPLFLRSVVNTRTAQKPDSKAYYGTPLKIRIEFGELMKLENHTLLNMFFTQPPVQHVSLEADVTQPRTYGESEFDLHLTHTARLFIEGGIRLRDVVSEMKKADGVSTSAKVVIYTHGVMETNEDDEQIVKERTEKFLNPSEFQTAGGQTED